MRLNFYGTTFEYNMKAEYDIDEDSVFDEESALAKGSFKYKKPDLTMIIEGEIEKATISGNKMTMEVNEDGEGMIFTRK